jgi:hypothetical protein
MEKNILTKDFIKKLWKNTKTGNYIPLEKILVKKL